MRLSEMFQKNDKVKVIYSALLYRLGLTNLEMTLMSYDSVSDIYTGCCTYIPARCPIHINLGYLAKFRSDSLALRDDPRRTLRRNTQY